MAGDLLPCPSVEREGRASTECMVALQAWKKQANGETRVWSLDHGEEKGGAPRCCGLHMQFDDRCLSTDDEEA